MWFADVAVGAAWLALAGWLGWVLTAGLVRRWAPGALARRRVPGVLLQRRDTAVAAGAGLAAVLNLAQAVVLDSVEDRSGVSRLDEPVLTWMIAHRSPDLTLFATTVSIVGSTVTWGVVAVVAVLWLGWRRRWLDATLLAVAAGGAGLLVTAGKVIMERPRPPVADRLVVETNPSLPSGHALASLVVIGMVTGFVLGQVATLVARIAVLLSAAVAVCLIGWSRLYLGVHWGTDVLAGWLLGAAWLTVCLTVLVALSRRSRPALGHQVTGRDSTP